MTPCPMCVNLIEDSMALCAERGTELPKPTRPLLDGMRRALPPAGGRATCAGAVS